MFCIRQCPLLNASFGDKATSSLATAAHQDDTNKKHCPECCKPFARTSSLNQHVRHPYPIAELSIIFLMHLDLDL
jgi:hypothetical protein